MNVRIRALLAALIVIGLTSATALVIGYRTGMIAAQSGLRVASVTDVRSLLQPFGANGEQLVAIALRKLETSYYEPIAPQTPLAGETAALQHYLRSNKIEHPALPAQRASGDAATDATRAAEVLAYAQQHYGRELGPAGDGDLTDVALRGIMNSVKDPYTVYLSPREIEGLNESLSGGNFGGIGVYIYQLKDGRIIVQPIEHMPAARSGMKPGEVVDTVDGVRVKGLPLDKVEMMIRGSAGTVVHLTAHPFNVPKNERSYSIVREIIHVPTVRAKMENGIDYIRLSDFGTTSASEVRNALIEGRKAHAKAYILDLRDNGGGLLDAAVEISSLFIPQGTIVSTIRRDGSVTREEALGDAISGIQPLAVLVNKYTASSAEITTGALQDYHRAIVIGTRTFGKGVVQSIYPMPDRGALKITTARYVTPKGRDIQHLGIQPDVVVGQSPDPALIDTPADKQLAVAKARLLLLTR
jgi:carboxyl-terminal processing protease